MTEYVPSPCIRICAIDEASGWCRGCWRTLDEISKWERYTSAEKQALLALCDERRALIPELPLVTK
jgi:predicted Fe-S protein YdhL (DUF1289 family)